MKNVPQLRFAGFVGEWEEFKLSDLGRISAGGDVDKKKIKTEGKYPVIANGDFNNGIIGYYDEDYKISEPAVTISARGNIGTAVARNYPFTPVIRVLTFISDNNIYFMSEVFNRLRIYNESSGVPQLTSPQFGEYKIFSTQLHEQEKIGDLFSKIDALIEKQEGKVSKMEDFKKSMLQKMFPKKGELVPEFRFEGFNGDWEIKKLGKVTSLRGGFAFKSENYTKQGIPILRISNINSNGTTNEDYVFYNELNNDDNISLENGSIVLAMSGATTGKVSILNTSNKVYQNQRVGYFIKSKNVDYFYLSVILRSQFFSKQLEKILIAGAQPNISSRDVEEFTFMFPDLNEQQKIGQFFKNLDGQIETEEKLLESYKQMKKSLLQKMFV